MFVRKSTHDAALNRAARAEAAALRSKGAYARLLTHCSKLEAENKALNAKLAVFTGPRKRDAKGHFLPAAANSNQVSAA